MRITCRKCGEVVEAEAKTAACPKCRTVLRRCLDCTQFDIRMAFCKVVNRAITTGDAHYPTFSSPSTYCREFVPTSPPE